MDESGIEQHSEYTTVAGFMGTEQQWQNFLSEWVQALGKRKAFHLHKLRWKEPRTRYLLTKLAPIPDRHGLERICVAVRQADYADLLVERKQPVDNLLASPYMLATHVCFVQTLRYLAPTETVHFRFERQDRYAPFQRLPEDFYNTQFPAPDGSARLKVDYEPKEATRRFECADYLVGAFNYQLQDPNSIKANLTKGIMGDMMMIGGKLERHEARQIIQSGFALGDYLNSNTRPSL